LASREREKKWGERGEGREEKRKGSEKKAERVKRVGERRENTVA